MMKKLYILSFTLFFLNLSAQIDFLNKITDDLDYGIKFGLSASHFASSTNNFNMRPTFLSGLTAEYPVYKKFNLKVDLLYLRQGESDRNNSNENGQIENTLKLDYFSIPVLLSYPIVEKLRLESGLGMAFLLRAKQEMTSNGNQIIYDNVNDIRNFDLNFNLGLHYPTEWNFVVGLRYSRGLIDVAKNDNLFNSSTFNSIFQLSL